MNKLTKFALLSSLLLVANGCNSSNNDNIIDYKFNHEANDNQFKYEGNYIASELTVDGVKDEPEWANASDPIYFGTNNKASVVLYRGERAIYAFFEVKDEDLQTIGTSNGDDVTKSDSIEIYFDFLNDGASKPQSDDIQINIGAHGRTRIFVGNEGVWGAWNGLLDYEIKLDGTLNSETIDTDVGFYVEMMIPYAQVGIEKDDTFGIAVGNVSRGVDSTNPTLDYTWAGITYDGTFIDPQNPSLYIEYFGNKFYSKAKVPMADVKLSGKVYDQENNPVSNATLKIDDLSVTTDENGYYSFTSISPNENKTINLSKDGYKNASYELATTFLRDTSDFSVSKDFILINPSVNFKSLVSGIVKNPADGIIANALVNIDGTQIYTDSNGYFEKEITVLDDINVSISKQLYKENDFSISVLDLAGNATYDLGDVALYSPSSTFNFGGSRVTYRVDGEVYRGFDGINFIFKTANNLVNGAHVQLFIDAKESGYNDRDTTDYRIDFNGDGEIGIVNFGGGSNTSVNKSGITSNAYLKGETYYIEAFIPYSFLDVTATDIIGFSCGSYANGDWDGFAFTQAGFEDYVAPEYPSQYLRVGLDNGLYRAIDNYTVARKIYGTITDNEGNPLVNANVDNVVVDENGVYKLYVVGSTSYSFTVNCAGYLSQEVTGEINEDLLEKNITLALAQAKLHLTIKNKIGEYLENATIQIKDQAGDLSYDYENNKYIFKCGTETNVTFIITVDGYKTLEKKVAKVALINAANKNEPYEVNVTLEEDE